MRDIKKYEVFQLADQLVLDVYRVSAKVKAGSQTCFFDVLCAAKLWNLSDLAENQRSLKESTG